VTAIMAADAKETVRAHCIASSDIAPAVACRPGQYITSDFPKIGKASRPNLSGWASNRFCRGGALTSLLRSDPHSKCFIGTFSACRDLRPDWIGVPA
jgi:hypothetical protein